MKISFLVPNGRVIFVVSLQSKQYTLVPNYKLFWTKGFFNNEPNLDNYF